MLKKAKANLAADKRRKTPIENKELILSYPRSSAFICGPYAFFSSLLAD
jgi:hypothetical protein